MLDDLLGRGFSSKVKSLIKVTKTRIEAVRKKRNATHKFLNKDIAHLLANGLDINAFGRAEGLVTELILSSCYDFLDHCCQCVLQNLATLNKKRECSEDCKVAVASLMFAAARFSDLPELRSLRQIFQGRYGNSLDHYVNQKFAKNLSSKPASMESKLQLLQDIAFQYSIDWNAKAFEQRMSTSNLNVQKEHLNHGSFCGAGNSANNYKLESVNRTSLPCLFDVPNQDSKENADSRNEELNERFFDDIGFSNVDRASNDDKDVSVRRVESDHPLFGGKNATQIPDHNGSKFSSRRSINTEVTRMDDSHTAKTTFPNRSKNIDAQDHQEYVKSDQILSGFFSKEVTRDFAIAGHKSLEFAENATPQRVFHREPDTSEKEKIIFSKGRVQAGDKPKIKHFHPPPYVKPSKVVQGKVDLEPKVVAKTHEDIVPAGVSAVERVTVCSGSRHEYDSIQGKFDYTKHAKSNNAHVKPPKGSKHVGFFESEYTGSSSQKGIGGGLDAIAHRRSKSDQIIWHESETQISERGRTMNHYQSEASIDHVDIARLILPKPRLIRRRSTRSSSNDSTRIDGSEKKYDEKRIVSRTSSRRRRCESRRIKKQHTLSDMDIPIKDEEKILDNLLIHYSSKPSNLQERAPVQLRSVSLPREQSVRLQPTKVFTRAATLQLDRTAQHVHPKLPDYEDLAARFSGMKAKF